MSGALNPEQLHILQHSLGLDCYGAGASYRNHFVTGEGSTDYPYCTTLVGLGLMERRSGDAISGSGDVFRVTDAGRAAVAEQSPPPPKITRSQRRYQAFLDADCGATFGEYLRRIR